jgi:hypothetical protein
MLTSLDTVRAWLATCGYDAQADSEAGAEALRIRRSGAAEPVLRLRAVGDQAWHISHARTLPLAVVQEQWKSPAGTPAPAEALQQAVAELAGMFPLVAASAVARATEVDVQLTAAVYREQLAPQAFALTLSSLEKAAQSLELLLSRRGELAKSLAQFEQETAAQRKQLEAALADRRMAGSSSDPVAASVVLAAGGSCDRCGKAWGAGERYCLECGAQRPETTPGAQTAARRCRNAACGKPIEAGKKFCGACGTAAS